MLARMGYVHFCFPFPIPPCIKCKLEVTALPTSYRVSSFFLSAQLHQLIVQDPSFCASEWAFSWSPEQCLAITLNSHRMPRSKCLLRQRMLALLGVVAGHRSGRLMGIRSGEMHPSVFSLARLAILFRSLATVHWPMAIPLKGISSGRFAPVH